MLGRTHAAVGALGSTIVLPIILRVPESSVSLVHVSNLKTFETIVLSVAAGVLGGLLPDLDQRNALLSRRVAWLGKALTLLLALAALYMSGAFRSPIWLGSFPVVSLLLLSQAEWMRKGSLLILAGGALWIALTNRELSSACLALTVWLCLAAFTPHRSFTHSPLGVASIWVAAAGIGVHIHREGLLGMFVVGYILHLVADTPSGGIPLLWPYPKRFGGNWFKTGGIVDHVVSVGCSLLVLGLLFV